MKYFIFTFILLATLAQGEDSTPAAKLLPELTQRYSQKRWSEFFGLAWYLRKTSTDAELVKKIATLESIALVRHCQTDLAKTMLPNLKNQKSEVFQRTGRFVEKWVELTIDTTLKKNTDDSNSFKGGVFKPTELLPFAPNPNDLSNLEPLRIRRPLKDLCDEEIAP